MENKERYNFTLSPTVVRLLEQAMEYSFSGSRSAMLQEVIIDWLTYEGYISDDEAEDLRRGTKEDV